MALCPLGINFEQDGTELVFSMFWQNTLVGEKRIDLCPIIELCQEEILECPSLGTGPIQYNAGPGNDNSAGSFVLRNQPTIWCVVDGPSGTDELWSTLKDVNGVWQWHQIDN